MGLLGAGAWAGRGIGTGVEQKLNLLLSETD